MMINNDENNECENAKKYEKQAQLHLKSLLSLEPIDAATQTKATAILQLASEQYLTQMQCGAVSWIGTFKSQQFEALSEKHPWLLPYRALLELDFEIDDFHLMNLSKQLETMSDSDPSKLWIEKLISNEETWIELLKIDFMHLEDVRSFCRKYPTLKGLRSTKWSLIEQEALCCESKQSIKKVWCHSALRKKILELTLPLELADELEEMNVTNPKDLSHPQITNVCHNFTLHEQKKFERWCLKEKQSLGLENRTAHEEKFKNEFLNNLFQVDARVKALRRKSAAEIDFAREIEEINGVLGLPQLEDWLSDFSRKPNLFYEEFTSYLNFIQDLIDETSVVLKTAPPPFETDEDLVAEIDDGAALRGLYIEKHAGGNVVIATEKLLKKPDVCVVQAKNSMTTHVFYFKTLKDAQTFTKCIAKDASIGIQSKLNSVDSLKDDEDKTDFIVAVKVYIYPVATFCFDRNQTRFSADALSHLQNCQDYETAKKFLREFGSHVSCGPITLGGIFCHSAQVSVDEPQDRECLKVYANNLLETLTRCGYCRYSNERIIRDNHDLQSTTLTGKVNVNIEFDSIFGPRIKHPKWFEEILKRNLSLCNVLERSSTPESLAPVWEIVSKHHHHLEPECRLLEQVMNSKVLPKAGRVSELLYPMLPNGQPCNNLELQRGGNPFAEFSGTKDGGRPHISNDGTPWDKEKTVRSVSTVAAKGGVRPKTQDYKKMDYFRHTKTPTHMKSKSYSHFLIDRPVGFWKTNEKQLTFHLIKSLRYRVQLSMVGQQSLYDTLLRLVDEYDAAGRLEIFRLLLERRSAIPLFIPDSGRHHLELLKYLSLPGTEIKLGEDKSLMRVAVVSCCNRNESSTSYLLKDLFHIDSIHYSDYEGKCVTSNDVTLEIGCGFLKSEKKGERPQSVLVSHVVGDFLPLWPFLSKFADLIIVEDESDHHQSFYNVLRSKPEGKLVVDDINHIDDKCGKDRAVPYMLIWKPSLKNKDCIVVPKKQFGFRHLFVECQFGPPICTRLMPQLLIALNSYKQLGRLQTDRTCLHEMTILEEYSFESIRCTTPVDIESMVKYTAKTTLGDIKTTKMVLQQKFIEQAQYEEVKNEYRLNEVKVREAERKVAECLHWRLSKAKEIAGEPLLQLLLQLLSIKESHDRVLSVRKLEQILGNRSAFELSHLLKKINERYVSYVEYCNKGETHPETKDTRKEELRRLLNAARKEYSDKVLSIEHLWREISHVYTSMPTEQRPGIIARAPHFGAQHLLDGFSIELLDGDANMIHMEWITDVLRAVAQLIGKKNRERIFVLSVMGVQSSGKSTLLNTMFGIQMRTSVGQCTRGVNMQLIKVEDCREYDYILLLDTEGCRAPEFHGLPGSEKRDNQMATLSILLADATIIVIPGENDAAVKDILPIVLLAYEDSKLAESKGGRLTSMLFFVYNRIDTTQIDKFSSIIQVLGTSLHDAFDQVKKSSSAQHTKDSLFRSLKLDTSNRMESDVCVLGNVKLKYEPPGDIPDPAYGETLKRFREHIHRRVTTAKKGENGWKGRSIQEFSEYIEEVWKCIGSANFSLNFANIREHAAFDSLDSDYKKIERHLAEAYYEAYQQVEKEMIEKKISVASTDGTLDGNEYLLDSFETILEKRVEENMDEFDATIVDIVNQKGREKWAPQYENQWLVCKTTLAQNWRQNLKLRFANMFSYEKQLENYKKEMRQSIRHFFEDSGRSDTSFTEGELLEEFYKIYDTFLARAKKEFPSKDIEADIAQVYERSYIIKKCQIDVSVKSGSPIVFHCRKLKALIKINHTDPAKPKNFLQTCYYSLCQKKDGNFPHHNTIRENEYECMVSVYKLIINLVSDKRCYDSTIVEQVIEGTKNLIICHNVFGNSSLQFVHTFARIVITDFLTEIHWKWEEENSLYRKLNSGTNKKAMYVYFKLVSTGTQKTQLFASTIANTLKDVLSEAFEKEMIHRTVNAIRNESWLHDARFMHKHIDLYLITLLEAGRLDQVLNYIRNPTGLYGIVLQRLIKSHIPTAADKWQPFVSLLEACINAAFKIIANTETKKHRAQAFLDELSKQLLDCKSIGLAANVLGNAFAMEYEDCGTEEKEFQKICKEQLMNVIQKNKFSESQSAFAARLSPKVIEHMKFLNDDAAKPRCNVACPHCCSLCIEPMNHDTKTRRHDAVHQPRGIVGSAYRETKKLCAESCSVLYENDWGYYPKENSNKTNRYRDFSTHYPDWKNPRIKEELPFREFLLSTYNKDIAKKYNVKPCDRIPAHFARDLSKVREQLKYDVEKK